jgi:hypothetical protein
MTMIPYPRFLELARANLCLIEATRDRGMTVLSVHYDQAGGPIDFMLVDDQDEYYHARIVPDQDDWRVLWIKST